MRNRYIVMLMAGVSTGALPALAQAQTTPAGQTVPAGEAPPPAAGADRSGDSTQPAQDVVVTGSRTVTNGNASPTPITVVSLEQIQAVNPQTVAEQLNEEPQFAGSQGQNTGAGPGSANNGNPASQGNVLNLRNFGFTRTLILYDSHRVAPNSPNGTVDIDMIPQVLLKRVDVVTGGASAVYGSDAVTGVVNFITDTTFTGFKGKAQAGISDYGDDPSQDVALAWGGNILGGAHLELSYEYRNDGGVDHRSARPWGASRYQIGTVSSANGVTTQRFVPYATRPGASFGGTINNLTGSPANPYANYYFVSPGVLAPQVTGDQVNTNVTSNGSGSYFDPSIKGSLQLHQFYGRLDYDIASDVHFYARGAYTLNTNQGYSIYSPTYAASTASNIEPIFVSNPYLPAAYATQMSAAGLTTFGLNKVFGLGSQEQYRQLTTSYTHNLSVDTGLSGSFGHGWKWELSYIYTLDRERVRQEYGIDGRKLAAALDAVNDGGTIKCWVNTAAGQAALAGSANAAALKNIYNGCVPLSTIFGPTIAPAEAAYIFSPLEVLTTTKQHDVEGAVTGSPFSTWAGPVNVAVSGQYRRLSYRVDASQQQATTANPLDCTGLRLLTGRYACTPFSTAFFQGESLSRPEVSVSVKEAAVEATVPLLHEFVLAKDLSVNGAYRYTDYSTSGHVSTWKAGLDWQPLDLIRFRGTYSRDIRAPSLNELFSPASVGSFNGTDVLLGVALDGAAGRPNPAGVTTSGNETLRPEKADTFTAGFVLTPPFVPGLSIALDYYNIRVNDAIISLNGQDIGTQTDCIASGGASPTCQLIVRAQGNCCTNSPNYANAIIRTFSRPINIGRQFTRGADLELNYNARVLNRGFNVRTLVSYQPKNVFDIVGLQTNVAGAASSNYAGFANARWRGTFQASIDVVDNVRFTLAERYRGKMNFFPEFSGTGAPTYVLLGAPADLPARVFTNIGGTFRTARAEFFVNVQNLLNVQPVPYAGFNSALPGNNGVAPGDDPVGRYFTSGIRVRF